MSRKIKFRVYQKTPSLNHKPGLYEVTGLDFYEGDYGGGEVCLRNKKGEQWTEYIKDVVLEQYTGLKDKNGKEIYEGDILDSPQGRCLCIWGDDGWAYQFKVHRTDWFDIVKNWHEKSEVIGNIHENPELLGGEQ